MEPDEEPREDESLDDDDREALRQDLVDVQVLQEVLAPKGIKGAVFYCPDCDEDHFLGWELLAGNLRELLEAGESPVHEPAFDPNPDEYVSWDYARGFLDGYESFADEEMPEVARRLVGELTARGWRPDEAQALVSDMGLSPPGQDGNPETSGG